MSRRKFTQRSVVVWRTRRNSRRLLSWTAFSTVNPQLPVFNELCALRENSGLHVSYMFASTYIYFLFLRFYYSLFTMVFQYMLPIIIVSVAYLSIYRKLRDRVAANGSQLEEKLLRERQRVQRTNKLLISITVIFILSWLPLNVTEQRHLHAT